MAGLLRPERESLQALVDMGFPESQASTALLRTHNCGVEPAAHWLIEHSQADVQWETQAQVPFSSCATSSGQPVTSGPEPVLGIPSGAAGPLVVHPDGANAPARMVGVGAECKVVLVVAQDLRMSPGKVAAQCAHAAVGLFKLMQASRAPWLHAWEDEGEKTVVLAGKDATQLQLMAATATALNLPCHLVVDAGRTEIPAGSATVLAIGGISEAVDQITGQLRTFK